MNTLSHQVVVVRGGYRVKLGKTVHVVDKQRHCSCARPHCPAIRAVADYLLAGGPRAPEAFATTTPPALLCPLCDAPASGSLEAKAWRCSADRYHYWTWRVAQLRAARAAAMQEASPYTREVLSAFASDAARAEFLSAHMPTYAAGG